MDLTGIWIFKEDFGFGKDEGQACFEQVGDKLKGFISFKESIEGENPFSITEEIEGVVNGSKVSFHGTSYTLFDSEEHIEYKLDKWEGVVNNQGQIVGSSEDEDGTCGVFIMNKKKCCGEK